MNDIVKRTAVAVLLLALLGTASCGDDEQTSSPLPVPPPWAKVAPEQIAEAKKHGVPVAFENELGMRFVLIPAGTFMMGSPEDEEDRWHSEDLHEVTLTKPFYIQITEVTNAQYRRFMPEHDSGTFRYAAYTEVHSLDGDRQPVVEVSWRDAAAFAGWLSAADGGRLYRVPTDAEWERACRADTTTPYAYGASLDHVGGGVRRQEEGVSTADVGSHPPVGRFPPQSVGPVRHASRRDRVVLRRVRP